LTEGTEEDHEESQSRSPGQN